MAWHPRATQLSIRVLDLRLPVRFFAFLALGLSVPAQAENVTADPERIAQVMTAAGYQAEVVREEGVAPGIAAISRGYNFIILFYGCDAANENCKTIQFFSGFETEAPPTLQELNDFSRDLRFGRVFLDRAGSPVIEMDVDLEDGGISEELFLDNLEYWELALHTFGDFSFSEE
jgi:hypothetical protein